MSNTGMRNQNSSLVRIKTPVVTRRSFRIRDRVLGLTDDGNIVTVTRIDGRNRKKVRKLQERKQQQGFKPESQTSAGIHEDAITFREFSDIVDQAIAGIDFDKGFRHLEQQIQNSNNTHG